MSFKGTKMFQKENQLTGLHGVPLRLQTSSQTVRGEHEEPDRRPTVAGVFEKVTQRRVLPNAIRMKARQAVKDEKQQNVQTTSDRAYVDRHCERSRPYRQEHVVTT